MAESSYLDVECMIQEVHLRPILWDVSLDDYKDKNKKTKAWMEVCETVYDNFKETPESQKKILCKYYIPWYLLIVYILRFFIFQEIIPPEVA